MQLKKRSMKQDELIQVWIPKSRIRRPFPLRWGLASLLLFLVFAVVTQLQFSRIANDKIFDARKDTYQSDVRAYDSAITAHNNCLNTVEVRATYRNIFSGITVLFQRTADLPASLFPLSQAALDYQESLNDAIEGYITRPVEETLPVTLAIDCPVKPVEEPSPPKR